MHSEQTIYDVLTPAAGPVIAVAAVFTGRLQALQVSGHLLQKLYLV
jgi:hypothetical protein